MSFNRDEDSRGLTAVVAAETIRSYDLNETVASDHPLVDELRTIVTGSAPATFGDLASIVERLRGEFAIAQPNQFAAASAVLAQQLEAIEKPDNRELDEGELASLGQLLETLQQAE